MTTVHLSWARSPNGRMGGTKRGIVTYINGIRKFITCRREEEVLARFQALQPSETCNDEPVIACGQSEADIENQPLSESALPHAVPPDESMLLANYSLNWLETFKKGKIRPSSFERYQFCLTLLCEDAKAD